MCTSEQYIHEASSNLKDLKDKLVRKFRTLHGIIQKKIWGVNEYHYLEPHQQERLKWLKDNSTGKILEIGCSTGYVSKYVGAIVGVDIDDRRLLKAKLFRGRKTRFIKMDARKLQFKNKEFDTVILAEVIEHLPKNDARKVISEAVRVGKKVLITAPKLEMYLDNPEHIWIPTQKEDLEHLLRDYKYGIFESQSGHYWFVIISDE